MAVLTQEQLNAIATQSGYGGTFSSTGLAKTPEISNKELGVLSSNDFTNQQDIKLPALQPDTENYRGLIDGGKALVDALNTKVETPDLTTLYSTLYGQSGIGEQQTKALESQKGLDLLNAQMASLSAEAQAVPIQIQQEYAGRGATKAGVAPIETARLRDIALRSLPLQGQILAQQAVATGDQRALAAAQQKFETAFTIASRQAEMQYTARKEQRDRIYDYLSKQEQRQLDARQREDDRKFQLEKMALEQKYNMDFLKLKEQFEGSKAPPPPIVTPSGQVATYGTPEYVIGRLAQTANSSTKPVASEREQLGKFGNVIAQTSNLLTTLDKTKTDPVIGYLKSLNPYDFDARAVNAQVNALVPNVARGVYGEVGVLTDQDIARYLQTLPNIRSTAEQNKFVALMTLSNAMRSYEQTLLNLANSNVNVAGFADSYKNVYDKVQTLEKELKIGQIEQPTGEDEAIFDGVVGTQSSGNYFSRLWNAIMGR